MEFVTIMIVKRLILRRLYERVTSHLPGTSRLVLLRETLDGFRQLYAEDKSLTEAVTPEMADSDFQQRVDAAAWTMVAHSLLNLELAKVKR